MAAPSGDGGRDAALWFPSEDETVVAQYSTAADWRAKIGATRRRLSDTNSAVSGIIYTSPSMIGADADGLRDDLRRQYSLFLDIRDQSWFLEREESSAATSKAAAQFADRVLGTDPELAPLVGRGDPLLNSEESQAALTYLLLQRKDDAMDRQLTKLSFDALVRAALRGTDGDRRIHRDAIYQYVEMVVPGHESSTVREYVDNALHRLDRTYVRHWQKEDEYCLTHEERLRLAEGIAEIQLLDDAFVAELGDHVAFNAEPLGLDLAMVDAGQIVERLRRVLEIFLFERGEHFVESLRTGQSILFATAELEEIAQSDLAEHADTTSLRGSLVPLISLSLERLLVSGSEAVQAYLRTVSEAYTLMAFLRETPNVQSAVSKLFSRGEIWLDTSAVLPLLAETLLEPGDRSYQALLSAVSDADARLFVTDGVLEEVNVHIDNSLRAWRSPATWRSRTPFILAAYIWSGREIRSYPDWIETFKGKRRPFEDLVEYFRIDHGIGRRGLLHELDAADEKLRWHSHAYWHEGQTSRRKNTDPDVIDRLVKHDVECFVGVLQRRVSETVAGPFGYTAWWLTADGLAPGAARDVAARIGMPELHSPCLSFDFLSHYVTVAPARRQLQHLGERRLPLMTDASLINAAPAELFEEAQSIRESMAGQPERVVQRRIRDQLDQEKIRGARFTRASIDVIQDDIREALQSNG